MSGRNPPSYCTLTLIAMQGHQQKGRQNNTSSNNKDKYNTIIETRTAEDHDDENLHNPETVQDAVIHLEVDEKHVNSSRSNGFSGFRLVAFSRRPLTLLVNLFLCLFVICI